MTNSKVTYIGEIQGIFFFIYEGPLILHASPLCVNPRKWSDTLTQFVGNLPTNCLGVFDHLVGLAVEGLVLELFTLQGF